MPWEPGLPHGVVGAAGGVVVTGVEALASVDDEVDGLLGRSGIREGVGW